MIEQYKTLGTLSRLPTVRPAPPAACSRRRLKSEYRDYLKPHGARRGLGHELYANGHTELAQSALQHASIETTHESYSDIKAAETAQQVDDVLEQ